MACSESFEWLSAREAVLLRPDAYVGSCDPVEDETPVIQEDGSMVKKTHSLPPILMKIFDEVLVNSLDGSTRDALMKKISCEFDETCGRITVYNDGMGIPIVTFKDTERLIPSVIFAELHAGSNFKDQDIRFGGGRNGVGVSCTNVWSTLFEVEICDGKTLFYQRFEDNLKKTHDPCVSKSLKKQAGFVKVSFVPDYARLGIRLEMLASTIGALIRTRCCEAAICVRAGVRIFYNEKQLSSKGSELLQSLTTSTEMLSESFGHSEKAGCTVWLCTRLSGLDYYGFINGIRCDAGTLTNHVRERIFRSLSDHLRKRHSISLRQQTLKDCVSILCVARIVNPRFTSQAKTCLSTPARQFDFSVDPTNRMLMKMQKMGIVSLLLQRESEKDLAASLKKTTVPRNKDIIIDKYDPALDCRTDPRSCTLILTEGDSAKAFVVAGLSSIGRSKFGIFPLRGVPLNVSNLSIPRMLENKEIANIFRILNVGPNSDGKGLRYGRVAICADQDSDGAHICGLLINFFNQCLPEVLRTSNTPFLQRIVTPLIKGVRKCDQSVRLFYSAQEFASWLAGQNESEWHFKYYKGLGTSSSKEARDIFKSLNSNQIDFEIDDRAKDTLELFYDESRIADRKTLLTTDYRSDAVVDYSNPICTVSEFMLADHVHFSFYSLYRALPSVVDGFTPSRRKVLYYFLSGNKMQEQKVAQAAAGVAQKTLYLHGENSLVDTIVCLAQDYVGTNNIAFLQPHGQFGSRNDKPSVHAAARYIFTNIDPITLHLFNVADLPVLTYKFEEGQKIEPTSFVPILPTLLINGATGIGTGFATCVPSFCVYSILANIRARLRNQPIPPIVPKFEGFEGDIEVTDKHVCTVGKVEKLGADRWRISELPVGKWTGSFLSELKTSIEENKPIRQLTIVSLLNLSTEFKVRIDITTSNTETLEAADVIRALRLRSYMSLTNMYAFDSNYRLKHFESVDTILAEYYEARLALYEKRRIHLLDELDNKLRMLTFKMRFVDLILTNKLELKGKTKLEVIADFEHFGLSPIPNAKGDATFDYLFGMNILAFTGEKIAALRAEKNETDSECQALRARRAEDMWLLELEALEPALDNYFTRLKRRHCDDAIAEGSLVKKRAGAKRRAAGDAPAGSKRIRRASQ